MTIAIMAITATVGLSCATWYFGNDSDPFYPAKVAVAKGLDGIGLSSDWTEDVLLWESINEIMSTPGAPRTLHIICEDGKKPVVISGELPGLGRAAVAPDEKVPEAVGK
jgi:hypothetical protein